MHWWQDFLRLFSRNQLGHTMSLHRILQDFQQRAAARKARVLLPDAMDARTIKAARRLVDASIAQPVLVGEPTAIESLALKENISLNNIELLSWSMCNQQELIEGFVAKRRHKGMTPELAAQTLAQPLFLSGMLLDEGKATCCVAGSLSSTAAVLRAALQTVGLAENVSTLSSFFVMVFEDRTMLYADCAVIPEPSAQQLCDIAISTAANYRRLLSDTPRVAMLSFSTKGSAESASTLRVREGLHMALKREPRLCIDGELQVDAAIVPDIAQRKAPDSVLRGNANVLIFPSLDAGNIAYKLSERLAHAKALGPIVQGLSKPYCDLSRGCSSDDIVNTACISILLSES